MRVGLIALFASALILAGCQSETTFNQGQELIAGSPAIKKDVINTCYSKTRTAPASEAASMARVMGVSPKSDVARTFCNRFFNAVASKRITYRDYTQKTPAYIRAIQGR
ncbi:hypothetical protein ATCR1_06876 [Agrobacterium tumefaciens CCNWGS0286]|uniref:hypothetical protein n=1 Tax=Agrobacterium tumefaciens TaxID=358 RepID=UPI0002334B27|nr:hypothetical protein [Agrobacterium tumefaciens]EHH07570.1 hypothetical protein ATCR1_06876 [Agrobacterium tumefaciens CCNWGS0286]